MTNDERKKVDQIEQVLFKIYCIIKLFYFQEEAKKNSRASGAVNALKERFKEPEKVKDEPITYAFKY